MGKKEKKSKKSRHQQPDLVDLSEQAPGGFKLSFVKSINSQSFLQKHIKQKLRRADKNRLYIEYTPVSAQEHTVKVDYECIHDHEKYDNIFKDIQIEEISLKDICGKEYKSKNWELYQLCQHNMGVLSCIGNFFVAEQPEDNLKIDKKGNFLVDYLEFYYDDEGTKTRFMDLISNMFTENEFNIEVTGTLHTLLCNQIRYHLQHTKRKNLEGKDCHYVFEYFAKAVRSATDSPTRETDREIDDMLNAGFKNKLEHKCTLDKNDHFVFSIKKELELYTKINKFIRKFKAELKTVNLTSSTSWLIEGFNYFLSEHYEQILELGEMAVIKKAEKDPKKPPEIKYKPNCVCYTHKIDLTDPENEEKTLKNESACALIYTGNRRNAEMFSKYLTVECVNALSLSYLIEVENFDKEKFPMVQRDFIERFDRQVYLCLAPKSKKGMSISSFRVLIKPKYDNLDFLGIIDPVHHKRLHDKSCTPSLRKEILKKIFSDGLKASPVAFDRLGYRKERYSLGRDSTRAFQGIVHDYTDVVIDYEYDHFQRGEYHETAIRCVAAQERAKSIIYETELFHNVKIINYTFYNGVFSAKIKGYSKNVASAMDCLNSLFDKRLKKFKRQLLPFEMYIYCKKHSLITRNNSIWKEFNVERLSSHFQYKNHTDYIVEIGGSSKSVHDFFVHIINLKSQRIEYENEDNWFEDVIMWPKRYLVAIAQRAINDEKTAGIRQIVQKESKIDKFLDASKTLERDIINELEIEYPETWEYTCKYQDIKDIQNYKTIDDNPYCFKVLKNSPEYKQVEDKFLFGSCRTYRITSIHRVQNPFLWNSYYCKRQEIKKKHCDDVNAFCPGFERQLWHGTTETKPDVILQSEEGVDRRYAKISGDVSKEENTPKFYGYGCYFSTTPKYSDNQYAFKVDIDKDADKTNYQLIICRVLVGVYEYGTIALEADQMRTLTKKDFKNILEKWETHQKQLEKDDEDLKIARKAIDQKTADLSKEKNKTKPNSETIKRLESDKHDEENKLKKLIKTKYHQKIYFADRKSLIAKNTDYSISHPLTAKNQAKNRYDSIMDDRFTMKFNDNEIHPQHPRMFVTFENTQAYPEYVITYRRDKKTVQEVQNKNQ